MKALKIIGWTLLSLVLVVVLVVTIACYIIFTPERLTPIARQVADKYVTAQHEIGKVELTFFSTFPYFGVAVQDVTIINPMEGAQSDTLLAVPELVASVKLFDAIDGNIFVKRFLLKDAQANIYIAPDGKTNFDVFVTDSTEEETDTIGGWQLRSVGWDETLLVNARTLTFVDVKDTISASLHDTHIALATLEKDQMEGAQLDLRAEDVSVSLKGEEYTNNLRLQLRLPALLADGSERVIIDGTRLQLNEFDLTLDGEVGTACFDSGEYNMDVTLHTGQWGIQPLLALVPGRFTSALKDINIDGNVQLDANAKGTYSEQSMPLITAHLTLKDGEGTYKPLPYDLRDLALDANALIDLNNKKACNVTINKLSAKTKKTQLSAKGQVDELMADMLLNLHLNLDANLPDFAYFLPEKMELTGRTKGSASLKIRLSDLTNMRLNKGKVRAELDLTDIHYAMDSMLADLPKTHAVIQLPNPNPSNKKANWVRMDLNTEKVDFVMTNTLTAKLKKSDIQLEAGDVLSKDPTLYAAVGLQSERPLEVAMDSMGGTIDAPKLAAYAEYNTKDTVGLHLAKADISYDGLEGFFKDIKADMGVSRLEANVSGRKKVQAKLKTDKLNARMGEELKAKTGSLALEVGARYNRKGENALLKWNPRVKINLKKGELYMPAKLPEIVYIPSIEFSYSNKEMIIDNSRIELGNSDLNLKGHVKNIGKWFRHKDILEGSLDIISNHCDANQLMALFSADKGSEEEDNSPQDEPTTSSQPSTTNKKGPFLVPTDVDLAVNTHMQEVEIFNQVAKDLKGGLYVRNGQLILDEMGFVCRAAKLQLTAMYRSPRRNHLYLGLDYHMIDVDIDELLSMIPNLEQMVPMLSSFKGAAQFHLAAETYLTDDYEPKLNTLRGAASLTGKDLVVLDGETFSKISKLLMFKKKTENKIDSINAEITVYKNEIDVYPLCVQMDNYMVALGGRHDTDMSFDYDINVLSPIYLGVNVSGTMDDLKIKLAKCKFAQDFKPHWYQKADNQSRELRERIKRSMEKNVRIQ